jgi:UDP-N-acetylglucosamine:LPS N-acetylglucosamine transferase
MKVLLACSSGGHFATMRGLKPFWSQHDRVWATDFKKDTQILEKTESVYWLPYQPPRDVIRMITNLPATFRILWKEKPDVVISTGASVAVNFAFAAWLLGIRIVYVESISRSRELSISGRLVYPIADEFYVQWPDLCQKYPKAVFKGYAA